MTVTDGVTLAIAIVALVFSGLAAVQQFRTARQANSLPVLVDLFREHRGQRLSDARQFVFNHLDEFDLSKGLAGLPEGKQELVRDLAWYYDNLGALVTHNVVDLEPVSGYLGGSVLVTFDRLRPLIEAERRQRGHFQDPDRWQAYFENLYLLVQQSSPREMRASQRLWRVPKN